MSYLENPGERNRTDNCQNDLTGKTMNVKTSAKMDGQK